MVPARRGKAFQSEILGIVAHDLKNPLSVILGRAEVIDQLLAIDAGRHRRCLATGCDQETRPSAWPAWSTACHGRHGGRARHHRL